MVMTLYNEDDCIRAAGEVSLRYVEDTIPGITRKPCGRGFAYFSPERVRITDETALERIKALAIPPAYKNVWICPFPEGHIQATGRDSKNRKQYRYHDEWERMRDQVKFDRVLAFGKALPDIRRTVARHISYKDLTRQRVLAALVRIMDRSYIRVGNQAYAKANGTYGLTTLRKKHVDVHDGEVSFDFKGKNGTRWHITLEDKKLIKTIQRCEEIPGYGLFKYIDQDGHRHEVDSHDLNQYLKDLTGECFTAKDFRTWAACKEAFSILCDTPVPDTARQQKITFNKAIKEVASMMGHTPSICKSSYLHPNLQEAWASGDLHRWCNEMAKEQPLSEEACFLKWWEAHYR